MENKQSTIKECAKSLMLYRGDFRHERDWQALCKALDINLDTKEINLKCIVCTAKNYNRKRFDVNYITSILEEFNYKYEVVSGDMIRVFLKDGVSYTCIENCDDYREDYYAIAGRVQNLRKWVEL
nr:MAG TPA: hypothetical protein [Caudoviricetes sp.]